MELEDYSSYQWLSFFRKSECEENANTILLLHRGQVSGCPFFVRRFWFPEFDELELELAPNLRSGHKLWLTTAMIAATRHAKLSFLTNATLSTPDCSNLRIPLAALFSQVCCHLGHLVWSRFLLLKVFLIEKKLSLSITLKIDFVLSDWEAVWQTLRLPMHFSEFKVIIRDSLIASFDDVLLKI